MYEQLIKAVSNMRDLQKQYFEARNKNMYATSYKLLPHCKDAERKVDRMLKEISGEEIKMPKLF